MNQMYHLKCVCDNNGKSETTQQSFSTLDAAKLFFNMLLPSPNLKVLNLTKCTNDRVEMILSHYNKS